MSSSGEKLRHLREKISFILWKEFKSERLKSCQKRLIQGFEGHSKAFESSKSRGIYRMFSNINVEGELTNVRFSRKCLFWMDLLLSFPLSCSYVFSFTFSSSFLLSFLPYLYSSSSLFFCFRFFLLLYYYFLLTIFY